MPIWLVAVAAAGIGGWVGSLTGTATTNVTSPASPQSAPIGTILLYGAGGLALVYGAKKVMRM